MVQVNGVTEGAQGCFGAMTPLVTKEKAALTVRDSIAIIESPLLRHFWVSLNRIYHRVLISFDDFLGSWILPDFSPPDSSVFGQTTSKQSGF
jgi:hypothetical protein